MDSPNKGKKLRKARLKADVKKRLFGAIQTGVSFESACHFSGVALRTFTRWKEKGKADYDEGKKTSYSAFYEELEKTLSISEISLVQDITRDEDWRAKAFILERRFPEWSKKTEVKVNDVSEAKKVIHYNVKDLTTAELDEILKNDDPNEFEN